MRATLEKAVYEKQRACAHHQGEVWASQTESGNGNEAEGDAAWTVLDRDEASVDRGQDQRDPDHERCGFPVGNVLAVWHIEAEKRLEERALVPFKIAKVLDVQEVKKGASAGGNQKDHEEHPPLDTRRKEQEDRE